jgi:hypothetical protein
MTFSFGHSEQERIEVEVYGYERAPVGEYYDDNWLTVDIRIQTGGFRGEMPATFVTGELVKFLSELRPLHQTLTGAAAFQTMEGQLSLWLTGDGKGHIELRGEVADQAAGNRLHFTLQFDQSQLNSSIRELERVTLRFPERLT